jgi:hypothetical protein
MGVGAHLQVLSAVGSKYDAGPEASHRVIHQDGDRVSFRGLGKTL